MLPDMDDPGTGRGEKRMRGAWPDGAQREWQECGAKREEPECATAYRPPTPAPRFFRAGRIWIAGRKARWPRGTRREGAGGRQPDTAPPPPGGRPATWRT